jgi:hypothetical protein
MHHRRTVIGTIIVGGILASAACSSEDDGTARPSSYGGAGGRAGVSGSSGSGGNGAAGTAGASGANGASGAAGTFGAGGSGGGGASGGSGGSSGGAGSGNDGGGTAGSAGTSAGSSGTGGTGTPMGTLLFEDFEDGNADGWIADMDDGNDVFGKWAVVTEGASKVYKEHTEYSDPSWTVGGDLDWKDQAAETKVQFVSSGAGDAIAYLAVRLQSKERYYFLEFQANESNGSLKVRKRVDGSTTDLISSYKTGMPVGPGTWYTIGLSAVGTTITAKLNGMVVGTATDSALTNGGIALGIRDAVAIFDDVKVTSQ